MESQEIKIQFYSKLMWLYLIYGFSLFTLQSVFVSYAAGILDRPLAQVLLLVTIAVYMTLPLVTKSLSRYVAAAGTATMPLVIYLALTTGPPYSALVSTLVAVAVEVYIAYRVYKGRIDRVHLFDAVMVALVSLFPYTLQEVMPLYPLAALTLFVPALLTSRWFSEEVFAVYLNVAAFIVALYMVLFTCYRPPLDALFWDLFNAFGMEVGVFYLTFRAGFPLLHGVPCLSLRAS